MPTITNGATSTTAAVNAVDGTSLLIRRWAVAGRSVGPDAAHPRRRRALRPLRAHGRAVRRGGDRRDGAGPAGLGRVRRPAGRRRALDGLPRRRRDGPRAGSGRGGRLARRPDGPLDGRPRLHRLRPVRPVAARSPRALVARPGRWAAALAARARADDGAHPARRSRSRTRGDRRRCRATRRSAGWRAWIRAARRRARCGWAPRRSRPRTASTRRWPTAPSRPTCSTAPTTRWCRCRRRSRSRALPGVTRRVYPGLRHETMNEPEGPEVVADVIAWLRAAVAATSGT